MATAKEKLTALADSIRSKSGATGPLTLDMMTEAVNALSTGEAMPEGFALGEFTATEDNKNGSFSISHPLGSVPYIILVWADTKERATGHLRSIIKMNMDVVFDEELSENSPSVIFGRGFYDTALAFGQFAITTDSTDSENEFWIPDIEDRPLCVGVTYRWMTIAQSAR